MSQITKRALASALKELLEHKPLNKITIADITEQCGVNRQTFYYHFQDIYALLEWIYTTDAQRLLEGKRDGDTWQQGFLQVLEYIRDNRALVRNTYHSVSRELLEQDTDTCIISTPYDAYRAVHLICHSLPIERICKSHDLVSFHLDDYIDDVRNTVLESRFRAYPILDENEHVVGTLSRFHLLRPRRKQVILVDHNERQQAVDGLEEADILEIIDHHRIGSLETTGPVYFRNVPVGCTATILYQMYGEQGLTPSREIAGLLLSAILSDTLVFRSPTSTPQDEAAAKALAALAGEDIQSYAEQMFEAGADLTGRTAEDVFSSDFKAFSRGDVKFGVGQSTYMTDKSRAAAEALVQPFLPEASRREGLPLIFYMFTDMKTQSTDLMFYGHNAEEIIRDAFHVEPEGNIAKLPGVVSRKKQLIPPLLAALQARQ